MCTDFLIVRISLLPLEQFGFLKNRYTFLYLRNDMAQKYNGFYCSLITPYYKFASLVCFVFQHFPLQLTVHINTECPLLEVPCKFVEAGCAFKVRS